jgi:hypothetical protein
MTSPLLGSAYVATDEGYFVSQEHQRIAEIINDYEPTLNLVWIPPDKREPGDSPFAVMHSPLGQPPYIVFHADECDERIIQRVFAADSKHHDILTELEINNRAAEAIKLKREMDEAEEKKDVVKSIVKSPKQKYKHNGVVYQ